MSHEQSETIKGRDGRWYNVYGSGTGADQPMPLPQLFGFEKPSYSTADEAVNKAAWRSLMGEGQYPMESPKYGFTNTYQPTPQAKALGKVIDALQDPRNAWIGLGPMAGVMRGGKLATQLVRDERGSWSPFGWGKNPKTMRSDDYLAAKDGGYTPFRGPSHYSPDLEQQSTNPITWAKLLDRRYKTVADMTNEGVNDLGMTREEALNSIRRLNLFPMGYDKTQALPLESQLSVIKPYNQN